MLASLLPGLRELRAPLAAGYLWLVAAWVATSHRLPAPRSTPRGLFGDVYELLAALGKGPGLAAATFTAYIAGVLSVMATAATWRSVRRRPAPGRGTAVAPLSSDGHRALQDAVLDALVDRSSHDQVLDKLLARTAEQCGESRELDRAVRRRLLRLRVDVEAHAAEVEADLHLVPLRLLAEGKRDDVYGEYDRVRAEAEFRASVALPLVAVVLALAWRTSPWVLLALAVPVLLVQEASRNATAAADVLAEAVRANAVASPALEQLRAGQLRQRGDWLERAAADGYGRAMTRLADTDPAQAEHWYRRAAAAGEASAMLWLAGHLQRVADPLADDWYRRAAEAGDPTAREIAEQAPALTLSELGDLRSAHAGDPDAMVRVGARLEAVGQDEEAARWYGAAADAGHPTARTAQIANLHRRGCDTAARLLESAGPTR